MRTVTETELTVAAAFAVMCAGYLLTSARAAMTRARRGF